MHIQHRKLMNAKFWQYAHQVSNAYVIIVTQNGLGRVAGWQPQTSEMRTETEAQNLLQVRCWPGDSNRTLMWLFASVSVLVILFYESNWNHELVYLFAMLNSPIYHSLIIVCWICETKKSSWFQFDSKWHALLLILAKEILQNWLVMLPSRTIFCWAYALET